MSRPLALWTLICLCLFLTIALGLNIAHNGIDHNPAQLLEVCGLVSTGLLGMVKTESL